MTEAAQALMNAATLAVGRTLRWRLGVCPVQQAPSQVHRAQQP